MRGAPLADFGLATIPTHYTIQPAELARWAEDQGFESLWFGEHAHIPTSRKTPFPFGGELPEYYKQFFQLSACNKGKEGAIMSLYQVNKLLRDVNRSAELAQRCQTEPDVVLRQYDLTPEEQEALKGWQVRKLYDMGANPLLLLVYSMATGKDMRAYVGAMNQTG
jgi:hypothetical protein